MAKVFLDANIIIDILEERKEIPIFKIDNLEVYISSLSIHIFFYVERKSIPYVLIHEFLQNTKLVDFTEDIVQKALLGPGDDFEDNVQLHSAVEAECDIFLTSDKKLLAMKFFGKTQIISPEAL